MILALIGVGGVALVLLFATAIRQPYHKLMYDALDEVPARRVALVFGAGVWPGGQLSPVLEDRVSTAVALYKAGKVSKLLMSGDNRFINYNEPKHMGEYAQALGVPAEDIVLDYAGRRTYDSCYRAVHIFQVSEAVLVTQRFHLPRALLIADGVGLEAVGMVADRRPYLNADWYRLREVLASVAAWWDVHVSHPLPVLGDKLPIK